MKSNIDEDGALPEISKEVDGEHAEQEEDSPKPPSSSEKEQSPIKQDDDQQIRLAKAQLGEVREENERLKQLLSNIVKDYQSLQMHFFQIMQQAEAEKTKKVAPTHQVKEETELTSLSLGRSNSSEPKKEEIRKSGNNSGEGKGDAKFSDEGLSLGLDCKFEVDSSVAVKNPTSENSIGQTKEEEPTETWPPSKMLKNTSSADDEVSQQPQTKKARVSVRTRCDTPTMHDGCQWRKYGQKIAKGNPCPRAYYRCTISPTCPVRKQVQRCVDDTSILITTYEGTHNHPLPLSATAMASTTSAAASMLNSRPSTSQQAGSLGNSISAPISFSTSTLPSGLNFSLSQNTIMPYQFPFPNTSIATANSHPTITLDLTNSGSIHHFNDRFPSSAAPRYSQSTCLSFSSPSPPSTSWNTNYPTWGSLTNKQPPSREHLHQSNHMQMNNGNQTINSSQQAISNHMQMNNGNQTINASQQAITAEAVKAIIASNPTFRSALAAAISSFVGNGNGGVRENTTTPGLGERIPGLNLHLGQSSGFNNTMPYSSSGSQNGSIGCGSNYLKEPPPSLSSQQVSLALFPPSLPLPTSSNASGSPASSRDHVKRTG